MMTICPSENVNAGDKPPRLEPQRLFWYAARAKHFMAQTTWHENGYQCLILFAAAHKQTCGDYGDYSIRRDEGILRQARDSLRADGFTIADAITVFFQRFRGDRFLAGNGMTVPMFKSALAKIKMELAKRKPATQSPRAKGKTLCVRWADPGETECPVERDDTLECEGYGILEGGDSTPRQCEKYEPKHET